MTDKMIDSLLEDLDELMDAVEVLNEWNPPAAGSKKRKEMPRSYFLDPKNRKYPYKKNGKISCEGLRSAIKVASFQGDTKIKKKAQRLYEKHCKKSK
jgi:hypothetical protein